MEVEDFREILRLEADRIMSTRGLDSREQINNGFCGVFARSVSDTVRTRFSNQYLVWSREDDTLTVTKNSYGAQSLVNGSHIWLEFNDLHFDAECVEGVNDPSDLPIFQRNEIDPAEL